MRHLGVREDFDVRESIFEGGISGGRGIGIVFDGEVQDMRRSGGLVCEEVEG